MARATIARAAVATFWLPWYLGNSPGLLPMGRSDADKTRKTHADRRAY